MREAGWISIPKGKGTPEELADICVNVKYQGPFDLIFYCYYAFPTDYPEHIKRIFGRDYFNQEIETQSMTEFRETIQDTSVDAVVTFNKGIFNHVSEEKINRYIQDLLNGELVQGKIIDMEKRVPIYLTFPTGWRYHKQFREFRKASLEQIKTVICHQYNEPGRSKP